MKHEQQDIRYTNLKVSSGAFKNNGSIPAMYTCDGKNINPSIEIEGTPLEAKSLAFIMDDPDAPGGMFVHWVMWNIPITHQIEENTAPGVEGINDAKKNRYTGPCPPSGTHRYFFKVYALDTILDLPASTNKHELELAMASHILAFGEIIGLYQRK